jgi:hypothetical protein
LDKFKIARLLRGVEISFRHLRRESRRQGLIKRRIGHPQRLQNVIVYVAIELFAAHALNDVSGEREPII